MLKTKGKVILTLLLTLIAGIMFATLVYAAPSETITIDFYTSGNAIDRDINTNDIVEGRAEILRGESIQLPARAVSAGSSFNWRTEDGRAWEGGSTVVFYESTKLFPVTAIDVSNADELAAQTKVGGTMRLLNDIYLDKKPDFPWPGTCTVLLNGKTLEISSSLTTAWGGQRAGTFFYGTGTIKYAGSGLFANINGHGWGGDSCRLFIGRSVTLDAPNAILAKDSDGSYVSGYPRIQIYGNVNCKTVLEMGNAGNRYPRVEVYDGAQLNINGPLLRHTVSGNNINVNIYGGTITTKSNESFFADETAIFSISGGSFVFTNEADYQKLEEEIDITTTKVVELVGSNGVTYKTAVMLTSCDHTYELSFTQAADCNNPIYDNFFCSKVGCQSYIHISHGTKGDHVFTEKPTSHKDPTKIDAGWDKYVCSSCSCVELNYIYYDPTNDEIQIIVNTGDGEKTVTATVKDVFVVNGERVITATKAFGSYTLEQIVGIYIPAGITGVKISPLNLNPNIKTVIFGAGIDATVTNMKGLTSLEYIIIENVSNLVFEKECATKTVKSIKSDISGANVEYKEQAFLGQASLTEMTFSKNSSYIFGKQSFKDSGVLSLEFVDGCRVDFVGEQAFYASKVEYLYVGKGITTLANKPFDCAYYLQKVILMDVTNLSTDYTFCCMNRGEKPCVVYHHADSLSLGGNTFYQSHGVILYTKAQITTGFNSCTATTKGGVTYPAYTIYYGITHEYERIDTPSTCTSMGSVKFVTTCPCGESAGTMHKVFTAALTNSSTYTEVDYTNKEIEMLPHELQSYGTIDYCDGYAKPGYFTYKCTVCKNGIKEGEAKFPPLVICYGYSVNEIGSTGALNVKYCINEAALRDYQASNGVVLEYGTVVALKKAIGEKAPLDENGNAIGGVVKLESSSDEYSTNSIKLSGLNDVQKSLNFVMSLYIIDGEEIYYIQDTETVENPSGVSYKEVKELADYYESLSIALPVATGDEE